MLRTLPVQPVGLGDVLFARALDRLRREPIIVNELRVRENPEDQLNEFIAWINTNLLAKYQLGLGNLAIKFSGIPETIVINGIKVFERESWLIKVDEGCLYFKA